MAGPNKLLADLGGKPVLAHVLDTIAAAGLPALVVTGRDRAEIEALSPFATAHAADYAEGLSRSLRTGVAAAPADWDAAIICLGDMPGVSSATLRALAAGAIARAIIVPTFGEKRGNPVLWGREHFPRLCTLEGDTGGKPLLSELAAYVIELAVSDAAILTDIDTPEALETAQKKQAP